MVCCAGLTFPTMASSKHKGWRRSRACAGSLCSKSRECTPKRYPWQRPSISMVLPSFPCWHLSPCCFTPPITPLHKPLLPVFVPVLLFLDCYCFFPCPPSTYPILLCLLHSLSACSKPSPLTCLSVRIHKCLVLSLGFVCKASRLDSQSVMAAWTEQS